MLFISLCFNKAQKLFKLILGFYFFVFAWFLGKLTMVGGGGGTGTEFLQNGIT